MVLLLHTLLQNTENNPLIAMAPCSRQQVQARARKVPPDGFGA